MGILQTYLFYFGDGQLVKANYGFIIGIMYQKCKLSERNLTSLISPLPFTESSCFFDLICPLIRKKKMSKDEAVVDFLVMPGIVQTLDYINKNPECYLVEKGGKQYLVKITKDFIKTTELTEKVTSSTFVIGSYKYRKAVYKIVK